MIAWGRAASAASAAALLDPTAWLVALAGFLVRGGLVVVLAPVVVLPTTTGIATVVGPTVISVVLGSPGPTVALAVAGAVGLALGWLVVGGLVGALTDIWLIRRFAGEVGPTDLSTTARVFGGRIVANVPLAIVVAWAVGRIVSIVYAELVAPTDVAAPLVVRVLRAAPAIVPAVVIAWLAAEAIGALIARRIVLGRDGLGIGIVRALGSIVRHPVTTLAIVVAWALIGALLAGSGLTAASLAWERLRTALLDGAEPLVLVVLSVLFSGLWLGALLLIGLAGAWGSALWTREVQRRERSMVEARPSDPPVTAVPTESVRAA